MSKCTYTIRIASCTSRNQICFLRGQIHIQNCPAHMSTGGCPWGNSQTRVSRVVRHAHVCPATTHPLHGLLPPLHYAMSAHSTPEEHNHPSLLLLAGPCSPLLCGALLVGMWFFRADLRMAKTHQCVSHGKKF